MGKGLNRVTLIGNLGKPPELKYTQSGQAVMNMRLATTGRFKGRDEQWQERTEWHNVVLWGKRAEGLAPHLKQGSKVYIEGSLRTRSWEGDDGKKRYATDVNARDILLLDSRQSQEQQQGGNWGPPQDQQYGGGQLPGQQPQPGQQLGAEQGDDIPF